MLDINATLLASATTRRQRVLLPWSMSQSLVMAISCLTVKKPTSLSSLYMAMERVDKIGQKFLLMP